MCADESKFVDHFSLRQKITMRLLMIAFPVVGAWAVFLHDVLWGLVYVGFLALGQSFLVLPALCGHCPYPFEYNDCLLLPAGLLRKLVRFRGPQISKGGKAALFIGMAGTVLLPQYWLFQEPVLLLLFWALLVPFAGFFPLYLCKHCRHTACPANRVFS